MHENCGVVGVFSLGGQNVIPFIIDCLRALQHRGQESWGLAVPLKAPFKKLGLVSSYASEFHSIIKSYRSNAAIGHVRYSTFGRSTLENAQPLKVRDLCIAHNGTIANADELSSMAGGCTFSPQTMSDTLIAAQRLVGHLTDERNITQALKILKGEMVGSFCFTFLTDDGSVYAARDSKGFRPLILGYQKDARAYIVASESCCLSAVGADVLRDVSPGELIKMNTNGIEFQRFSEEKLHSHCAFEYTYFAHPASIIEGVNVYEARKRIGTLLAKKFPLADADVVIPVPDSARPAALAYAQALHIPYEEGLLKDKYSRKGPMRSFIEPYQQDRIEINKGIIPIRDVIEGKHVVVIDDSIVRGTSSASIVKILRAAGAKRISMIITFPPIRYPCYAGVDFPSQQELLAYHYTNNNKNGGDESIGSLISKAIGADYVAYNDSYSLSEAIGIPEHDLCFSCSNGNYSPLGIKPVFKSRKQLKGETDNN